MIEFQIKSQYDGIGGNMPADIKITTDLLYKGALMDAVYIPLLVWCVNEETFRKLKWPLVVAAALVWMEILRHEVEAKPERMVLLPSMIVNFIP
jgi:hypothetical protein